MKLDIKYNKRCTGFASQFTEQLIAKDLRKPRDIRRILKLRGEMNFGNSYQKLQKRRHGSFLLLSNHA